MPRTADKARESNRRGSITSVYEYTPVTATDSEDALQRFGVVKVEATSFTISEPFKQMEIAPLLYDKATPTEKDLLEELYNVQPFSVNTIHLERIFADKILAAEFYYQREDYMDVAKHIFDLSIMMEMPEIQRMLSDDEMFVQMLGYKREEERERIGSDLADKPFSEFQLFDSMRNNVHLQKQFERMQRIYVFDERNVHSFSAVADQMDSLYDVLLKLDEGLELSQEQEQGIDFPM